MPHGEWELPQFRGTLEVFVGVVLLTLPCLVRYREIEGGRVGWGCVFVHCVGVCVREGSGRRPPRVKALFRCLECPVWCLFSGWETNSDAREYSLPSMISTFGLFYDVRT